MKTQKENIEKYRSAIDEIDDKILNLLSERASIVKKVGATKNLSKSRKSIIRPGREADMIRRIAKKNSDDFFPRAAVAQMWRMIISSAINIEENARISTFASLDDKESYWLAREYFGSFTPIEQRPTIMDAVADVVKGNSTVCVAPLWDKDATVPWWAKIIDAKDPPKIFAKLPFIQMAPSEKVPLVAMGYVEPEKTEQDESIWVIKAPSSLAFADVEAILNNSKLEYEELRDFRVIGYPTMHCYLMKFSGFIDDKNRKIKNFIKKVNELPASENHASAHWLGSYATPILFGESDDV